MKKYKVVGLPQMQLGGPGDGRKRRRKTIKEQEEEKLKDFDEVSVVSGNTDASEYNRGFYGNKHYATKRSIEQSLDRMRQDYTKGNYVRTDDGSWDYDKSYAAEANYDSDVEDLFRRYNEIENQMYLNFGDRKGDPTKAKDWMNADGRLYRKRLRALESDIQDLFLRRQEKRGDLTGTTKVNAEGITNQFTRVPLRDKEFIQEEVSREGYVPKNYQLNFEDRVVYPTDALKKKQEKLSAKAEELFMEGMREGYGPSSAVPIGGSIEQLQKFIKDQKSNFKDFKKNRAELEKQSAKDASYIGISIDDLGTDAGYAALRRRMKENPNDGGLITIYRKHFQPLGYGVTQQLTEKERQQAELNFRGLTGINNLDAIMDPTRAATNAALATAYAPAAAWSAPAFFNPTIQNILAPYFAYEAVKPDGILDQAVDEFAKGEYLSGTIDAGIGLLDVFAIKGLMETLKTPGAVEKLFSKLKNRNLPKGYLEKINNELPPMLRLDNIDDIPRSLRMENPKAIPQYKNISDPKDPYWDSDEAWSKWDETFLDENLVKENYDILNTEKAKSKLKELGVENHEHFMKWLRNSPITTEPNPTGLYKYTDNWAKDDILKAFSHEYNINIHPTELGDANLLNESVRHEIGHLVQRYLQATGKSGITNLDELSKNLSEYTNLTETEMAAIEGWENKSIEDVMWNVNMNAMKHKYPNVAEDDYTGQMFRDSLSKEQERKLENFLYFIKGSGGLEGLPFLRETKSNMIDAGIINSFDDIVTVENIEKLRETLPNSRVISFTKNSKEANKLIADLLNKTPAIVGTAGAAAAAATSDEDINASTMAALPLMIFGKGKKINLQKAFKNISKLFRNTAVLKNVPFKQSDLQSYVLKNLPAKFKRDFGPDVTFEDLVNNRPEMLKDLTVEFIIERATSFKQGDKFMTKILNENELPALLAQQDKAAQFALDFNTAWMEGSVDPRSRELIKPIIDGVKKTRKLQKDIDSLEADYNKAITKVRDGIQNDWNRKVLFPGSMGPWSDAVSTQEALKIGKDLLKVYKDSASKVVGTVKENNYDSLIKELEEDIKLIDQNGVDAIRKKTINESVYPYTQVQAEEFINANSDVVYDYYSAIDRREAAYNQISDTIDALGPIENVLAPDIVERVNALKGNVNDILDTSRAATLEARGKVGKQSVYGDTISALVEGRYSGAELKGTSAEYTDPKDFEGYSGARSVTAEGNIGQVTKRGFAMPIRGENLDDIYSMYEKGLLKDTLKGLVVRQRDFYKQPVDVAGTMAHEDKHVYQALLGYLEPHLTRKFGYPTGGESYLGKALQEVLVNPKAVKDPDAPDAEGYTDETYIASPIEVDANFQKERVEYAYKKFQEIVNSKNPASKWQKLKEKAGSDVEYEKAVVDAIVKNMKLPENKARFIEDLMSSPVMNSVNRHFKIKYRGAIDSLDSSEIKAGKEVARLFLDMLPILLISAGLANEVSDSESNYKKGGSVEIELDDNEVQDYIRRGYTVEEID